MDLPQRDKAQRSALGLTLTRRQLLQVLVSLGGTYLVSCRQSRGTNSAPSKASQSGEGNSRRNNMVVHVL
jgi:hypothetical protein